MLLKIQQGLNLITDIPNVKTISLYLPKIALSIVGTRDETAVIEIIMKDKHAILRGTLKVK